MALLRDVICKARPTVQQLIDQEIKNFNLKILSRLTIKYDPFREDVAHIRQFSHLIHRPDARSSNLKFAIKTEIITDRSEHTITFDLNDGQKFIFKCANLKTLEIFRLINQHITPLSPVEEITSSSSLSKLERKVQGAMGRKEGYNLKVINSIYRHVPAFTDIFDEETWYVFVTCVVIGTILMAFIISRFVTIKPVE